MCSSGRCRPVNTSTEFKLDNYDPKDLAQASAQDWWSKWQAAVTLKAEPPSPDAGPLQEAEPAPAGQTKSVAPEKLNLNPQYFSPGMEVEGLAKAILFAVLAGLILNFMPCVLPVISLKLRSLFPGPEQKDMQEHKKRFRLHNLFFALGILIYFLVLATIIAITEMAWGQIFQNPIAVLILATIVFILSLSLLDVFNLPVIDLKGSSHQSSNYKLEALSTGVLATLLATPCSGPFLGGVLAWGLLQPPLVIATVLTFVGVGMALPYLIMVVYPSFVHIFTRPGNWMIHLERIVAFLLIATCIYLLSLLPPEYYLKALILLWTAGLGAWIWGQWTNLSQSAARRWGIRSISILLILAAGFYAASPPAPPEKVWQEFEMQTFRQQLGQKPLLVEFTANWCPNCKLLEKTVLKEEAVKKLKEQYSLQAIKVDLSYRSPKGMGLLKELGSQSIPLLAIFPAGKESSNPVVIRDLFSEEDLHMALEKALQ
jgi:thiol:disulfide interchange protein DsbD